MPDVAAGQPAEPAGGPGGAAGRNGEAVGGPGAGGRLAEAAGGPGGGAVGRLAEAAVAAGRAGRPLPRSAAEMLDLLGGRAGMLDSAVPGALFVAAYVITRRLTPPLVIAAGAATLLLVYRLARRHRLRHALGGFFGVAVAVGLAVLTGKPQNYFVPTLAINAGYALASAISLAARWPLLGLVFGTLLGEGTAWRDVPARRRAYTAATALWFGMFALRVAVLFPLWLAGLLVPLGIGRIVLGYPLYALVVWLTWLIVRPGRQPATAPS